MQIGNLARAGFGATSDGMWPYSYSACDVGTLANQTYPNATSPITAFTSGLAGFNGSLSYQPGQRASACTCPSDSTSHPGPSVAVGRGAPEVDILEAQVSLLPDGALGGTVSQSAQFAPYDAGYEPLNVTGGRVLRGQGTYANSYVGQVYQEAVSAVSPTDARAYELGGRGFASYGVETWPGGAGRPEEGFMTWQVGSRETWTLNAAAVGPNAETEIGQRLVSQEPMVRRRRSARGRQSPGLCGAGADLGVHPSPPCAAQYLILNLAMSQGFETIDLANLQFPARMFVDYVRVYQRAGEVHAGCDPAGHPTSDYISNHENAYSNGALLLHFWCTRP